MLLLLIDENFNHRILRGLRLRVPALDVVIVQETAMQGLQDPLLLREAAGLQRILVTHDLKTIPGGGQPGHVQCRLHLNR